MKYVSIFFVVALLASFASASIQEGNYNAKQDSIEMDVSYGGGCGRHSFSVKLTKDANDPKTYLAQLIHNDPDSDRCEAYLTMHLSFPLSQLGLDLKRDAGAVIKFEDGTTIKLPR